jgi:hypothetical protein
MVLLLLYSSSFFLLHCLDQSSSERDGSRAEEVTVMDRKGNVKAKWNNAEELSFVLINHEDSK